MPNDVDQEAKKRREKERGREGESGMRNVRLRFLPSFLRSFGSAVSLESFFGPFEK